MTWLLQVQEHEFNLPYQLSHPEYVPGGEFAKDSDIYEELSDATGTVLVADIFSDVLSDADLRADQIHPNARGYQVFADGIADQLAETGLLNR